MTMNIHLRPNKRYEMTADAQKTVVLTIKLDYPQLQSLITLLEDNPDIVNPLKKACAGFKEDEAEGNVSIELHANCNPAELNRLGSFFEQCGHPEGALSCFQEAAQLAPENSVYQNSLGYCLLRLNRFGEALPYFQRAVELDKENPWLLHTLGDCFAGLGQTDKALEHFRLALDLSHDSGEEIRLMMRSRILGKIFLLTGNTLDGIETLQAAFDRATQEEFLFVAKDCSRWIERAHSSPAPL